MQAEKFFVKVITKIQTAATRHEILLKLKPNNLLARYLNDATRHSQFANREFTKLNTYYYVDYVSSAVDIACEAV